MFYSVLYTPLSKTNPICENTFEVIKKIGEHIKIFSNLNVKALERCQCCLYCLPFLDKCDALCNLLPFVQFEKREKHPWRSVNFSKVAA